MVYEYTCILIIFFSGDDSQRKVNNVLLLNSFFSLWFIRKRGYTDHKRDRIIIYFIILRLNIYYSELGIINRHTFEIICTVNIHVEIGSQLHIAHCIASFYRKCRFSQFFHVSESEV